MIRRGPITEPRRGRGRPVRVPAPGAVEVFTRAEAGGHEASVTNVTSHRGPARARVCPGARAGVGLLRLPGLEALKNVLPPLEPVGVTVGGRVRGRVPAAFIAPAIFVIIL